jgi:cyclophilin family peptidyl-prolyl cis-trans isomerase
MNSRCFKSFFLFLAVFAVSQAAMPAASVGPDVAIMEIRVGNEKQNRQIVIGLYDQAAPATVANFKDLATRGFYKGIRFHRVFPGTMVQTGDPLTRQWLFGEKRPIKAGTGGPGFTIPAEIRLPHKRGSVAMSRLPDLTNPSKASNGSQFYITLAPAPKLDGKYTVFGEILEGLDILDEISNLPADTNDFPLPNVVIKSITIAPRLAAAATP